ncbi:hypothetical protein MSG28_009030 [Choristoneura fumiferana]|uniref:Uncharacterized protein n=1 Tax=Choristoneura fumiferana TaxID=7141 RepID=A0ACC0J8X2_CHOFU|nr:hypothetical protein MSG28_009030 [Choristoneura fumiferana]
MFPSSVARLDVVRDGRGRGGAVGERGGRRRLWRALAADRTSWRPRCCCWRGPPPTSRSGSWAGPAGRVHSPMGERLLASPSV